MIRLEVIIGDHYTFSMHKKLSYYQAVSLY
jgi:hypothetical protein